MNRIALVIGNSKYMNVNQLKNPQNDANDMAIILDKLGFKVIKYLDLNLIQIENAVRQFLIELDEYSAGLFYYAGHGMQIDGKNYIVPIDCEIRDKTYTILSSFDICKYLDGLSLYKGKTNICILDACRDNPFATSLRDIANGFAPFNTQPKGTIMSYYSLNHRQSSSDLVLVDTWAKNSIDKGWPAVLGLANLLGSPYGNHWVTVYAYSGQYYKAHDNWGAYEAIIHNNWSTGLVWMVN